MKITIITVCYNAEKYIEHAIRSLLAQRFQEFQYIVVDGGSSDGTKEILRKYSEHIDVIISEPDQGLYDAMNKGLSMAIGDVVGVLNADDFLNSDRILEEIAATFEKNVSIDMAFGNVVFVDADSLKIKRYYDARFFRAWMLRFGWMPPHTACFIRKSVFEKFGNYSLDFRIAADYELFVRTLYRHGLKFEFIDKVLVRMRTGGLSTAGWRSSLLINREIVRACSSNGLRTSLLVLMLKIPFKLIELIRRPALEDLR